ncbi:DNA-3-methyladenine glycosylase 2 family protein [Schlesneria paludicola]|uniref:DNA-3-methyladenine glycosylase 2 family protein n=1 Tax=Schlesneria paludicola TaxID=360056 RepID=UPI00029A0492|nr:DNA-3-methyladenine glycosylase 2 family protein [Schlesneria paludicola]
MTATLPPNKVRNIDRTVLGMSDRDLYEAILTRDRRFDGRMFIGVSSTRIYCRPICTVRPPKFENCSFYRTAATAEAAGFRPCLRCRPELAPGSSAPVDAVSRLAALAVRRIEDGALSQLTLDELAAEFGVTARHLRRAVQLEAGLSPIELAQTQRLLAAKQLLTDTKMSVTDAAFAAGFESVRRFNTAFKERYRLTPTSLRRSITSHKATVIDAYGFALAIRPPFDWDRLLDFWQARATPGVEHVAEGWYRRTVVIGGRAGWAAIGPGRKPHTVQVFISTELGPVLTLVLSRLKAMLDVRADPVGVAERLAEDPMLARQLKQSPGPRVPGAFEGFECGIRAILGQQISVRAATTLAGRLARRYGQTFVTPYDSLTAAFPSPAALATADIAELKALGLTTRRAETIQCFATAVDDGAVRLDPGADPERVRSALMPLPGIGDWTIEYILMRAVGWPDAFPASDLGLIKASGLSPTELRLRSERWRPWRSYAAMLLWQSLENFGETQRTSP